MTRAVAVQGVLARLEIEPRDRDPGWLVEARLAALAWVAEHGFPTRKDEDWRYTQLAPILELSLETTSSGQAHELTPDLVSALSADLGGIRLVFINGHLDAALSRMPELPEGVMVSNFATVLAGGPERVERFFSRVPGQNHAFAAFNDALAEDGAFIHLAPGASVDEPIELIFLSDTGGSPLLSSPRSVVLAEAGSRATIVETYSGMDGEVYCTNAVTEVILAAGAHIEHYKVQNEADTAFHVALLKVEQGSDSWFSSHSFMFGARIARHEVRVGLEGSGAEVNLDGLYLPQGDQLHDNTIFVDHIATNATSHQLYKGVLEERGHGIFNGQIMVRPGADGSDANQKNKNLILSDGAEVDTRPRLEIYADDVKCTHGAAVGQLDEEAVLYLRSRGLSQEEARSLLVTAFIREMVDRVDLAPLRRALDILLGSRSLKSAERARLLKVEEVSP
jgi:Fe-S cluster assembly protein SufD